MNKEILDILKKSVFLLEKTCRKQADKVVGLQEKITEGQLIVSVVGQFKRGKSTFINSILKSEILPVGIVPVTSVITRIQYGDAYSKVSFKDGKIENVSLQDLVHYISEQENPGNQKEVLFVDIYIPSDFLMDGISVVDTPGV